MTRPFEARIKLFDNSDNQELNDRAPILTGMMEVPASQIDLLYEKLEAAETKTYSANGIHREYKVLDVSCWYAAEGSSMKYNGSVKMPYVKPDQDFNPDEVEQTSDEVEQTSTLQSSDDGELEL